MHRTRTDGTTIDSVSAGSIDGWTYDESVEPLGERIYRHVHLSLSLQLIDASFLWDTGGFIPTACKIPYL